MIRAGTRLGRPESQAYELGSLRRPCLGMCSLEFPALVPMDLPRS